VSDEHPIAARSDRSSATRAKFASTRKNEHAANRWAARRGPCFETPNLSRSARTVTRGRLDAHENQPHRARRRATASNLR